MNLGPFRMVWCSPTSAETPRLERVERSSGGTGNPWVGPARAIKPPPHCSRTACSGVTSVSAHGRRPRERRAAGPSPGCSPSQRSGVRVGEGADAQDRLKERVHIGLRRAAETVQERERRQRPNHLVGIDVGERRDADGHVSLQLHGDAPSPARDHRPEHRSATTPTSISTPPSICSWSANPSSRSPAASTRPIIARASSSTSVARTPTCWRRAIRRNRVRTIPDVLEWKYTGNNLHPTQKPVCVLTPLVESFSNPGDVVLDPFCGSGSTLLAARELNRRFLGIELSKQYFDLAEHRLR